MNQQQSEHVALNRGNENTSNSKSSGSAKENEQRSKTTASINSIRLNQPDPRGFRVTDIFWCTHDYVIFKAGGRVSPMFSDDKNIAQAQRIRYMQLGQSLARINTLEPGRVVERQTPVLTTIKKLLHWGAGEAKQAEIGFSEEPWVEPNASSRDYFSREIARAVALCLEDMMDESGKILDALELKIVNLKQNEYRMLYLLACFGLMVVYVGTVIFLTYDVNIDPAKNRLDFFVANNTVALRATLMGALAGFFSVSLGIKNLNFDLDARSYLIISYGFMRLFVAIIASLFIYYAIRSGFVFANLQSDVSTGIATLYVLAFLSGFSEHFVPNVLKKIEQGQQGASTEEPKGEMKQAPDVSGSKGK